MSSMQSEVARASVGDSSSRAPAGLPLRGVFALLGAFSIWGLLPLYLRTLRDVSPFMILVSRSCCCCVFVNVVLWMSGSLGAVFAALSEPRTCLRLVATSLLISVNWLVFTVAVASGHVVEASLGYFINPLVNVLFGVLVLRERLRVLQWVAVAMAACGVVYLAWLAHAPPFIALTLAVTFSAYGLLRKTLAVASLPGLAAETLVVLPLGLAYWGYCEWSGQGVVSRLPAVTLGLLLAGGVVTAVPLWLFTHGARLVRYSTVGLFQYLAPSLQLASGVLVLGESLSAARFTGFAIIWAACVLYTLDSVLSVRGSAAAASSG